MKAEYPGAWREVRRPSLSAYASSGDSERTWQEWGPSAHQRTPSQARGIDAAHFVPYARVGGGGAMARARGWGFPGKWACAMIT
jgi:hypothetical protein